MIFAKRLLNATSTYLKKKKAETRKDILAADYTAMIRISIEGKGLHMLMREHLSYDPNIMIITRFSYVRFVTQ